MGKRQHKRARKREREASEFALEVEMQMAALARAHGLQVDESAVASAGSERTAASSWSSSSSAPERSTHTNLRTATKSEAVEVGLNSADSASTAEDDAEMRDAVESRETQLRERLDELLSKKSDAAVRLSVTMNSASSLAPISLALQLTYEAVCDARAAMFVLRSAAYAQQVLAVLHSTLEVLRAATSFKMIELLKELVTGWEDVQASLLRARALNRQLGMLRHLRAPTPLVVQVVCSLDRMYFHMYYHWRTAPRVCGVVLWGERGKGEGRGGGEEHSLALPPHTHPHTHTHTNSDHVLRPLEVTLLTHSPTPYLVS
jgi:hypothetical protein